MENNVNERSSSKKKSDGWTDTMVGFLLTEWQFHDCLYNVNHADYHNTRKRNLALEIISTELQLPIKEIQKKMVGLRSYYGQLKQKVRSSIKSGAGSDEVFTPQWPFFNEMDSFLSDFVTPRTTESNIDTEENIVDDVNDTIRSSSATYKRKKGSSGRKDSEISVTDQVMLKALERLDKPKTPPSIAQLATYRSNDNETQEDLFGRMIAKSLIDIDDKLIREKCKLQIQQLLFDAKFQNTTSGPLSFYNRANQFSSNSRATSTSANLSSRSSPDNDFMSQPFNYYGSQTFQG